MSDICKWVHEQIAELPLIKYPFRVESLPENGVYFFYEKGEIWGHGSRKSRIVRIGSCKNGNFKSRISEHYLLNEMKMKFTSEQAAPKERSIFRKNLGRALLNRSNSVAYLKIWEIDFTDRETRKQKASLRDIEIEKKIERQITRLIREDFSFRFIAMKNAIGSQGLESNLIGTIAQCEVCRASKNWLGLHSPIEKIRRSGLWLVQHLDAEAINDKDKITILAAIDRTRESFKK